MLLNDAKKILDNIINIPFRDFMTKEQLENIIINKGKAGQLLEIALGLTNSSCTLDFEDGELKTNKCNFKGEPLETIFITQVSSSIDDLITEKNFYDTNLYKKISNILYVPICKEGFPDSWMFLPYIHINLNSKLYTQIKEQLEMDYYDIC